MENKEERFILSNLHKMLDCIEQIRELSWDIKYSSLDIESEIESTLDLLTTVLMDELEIKESVLLRNWNP